MGSYCNFPSDFFLQEALVTVNQTGDTDFLTADAT